MFLRVSVKKILPRSVFMILRSPTEHENEGTPLHIVLSSTRHSRAGGNPGSFHRISLDTRVRGYDGAQAAWSLSSATGIFKGEREEHEVFVGAGLKPPFI
ncbi:MAG: hypothetical protein ACREP5_04735, partial [Candidatus Binatia bacterium]